MLWKITHIEPHSGGYKIAFPYSYTEDCQTRLILPYIDISETPGPILYFWHKQKARVNTYDVPYTHQDTLRIYYRNELNGNWILLREYKDEIAEWTEELIELPNPGTVYQIAFDAYSLGGKYVLAGGIEMDDIYIGTTSICPAPVDLKVATSWNDVVLSWGIPEENEDFHSYNVYRDDILLENVAGTSYTDPDIEAGLYSYCIEAVYDNLCRVSTKTCVGEPVFVANKCGEQVQDVSSFLYQPEEHSVVLSWGTPDVNPNGEKIFYNENYTPTNAIGTAGGTHIAIKWEAGELENMKGKHLTSVRFVPSVTTPYSIRVWTGGSEYDPGTLVVDKQVPTSGLKLFEWNEIPLGKSIPIDPAQELWIGLYNTNGYANEGPMFCDNGPVIKAGKSNLIYYQNRWQPLSFVGGMPYNWALAGVVTEPGALIGYNIFRDGEQLNNEVWVANTYADVVPEQGNYTYGVSAIWGNLCISEPKEHNVTIGESPCNTAIALPFKESFDDEHFPVLCWSNKSNDNLLWRRVATGTYDSNVTPYSGTGMLEFQCNNFRKGTLSTPLLGFEEDLCILSFRMYRDDQVSVSRIEIYLSENGDVPESAPAFTAYRRMSIGEQTDTEGWYEYRIELDCSAIEAGYILFHTLSYGGSYSIHVDDIKVFSCQAPANFQAELTEGDGICTAHLSWNTPEQTTLFNIYRDNQLVASNITTASYTDNDITLGEHQWHIRSACSGEESNPAYATATCTPIYTITATAGEGGTITPSEAVEIAHGADKTFTISPITGYAISEVLIDDVNNAEAVNSGTYTFVNVTGPHTIAASFKKQTYTITAVATGEGAISPEGDTEVEHGADQTFTFTPSEDHIIKSITVDQETVEVKDSYTFENVAGNHRIEVVFEKGTGIDDIMTPQLTVYPNPTRDQVTIESDNKINHVQIFDITGRTVLELHHIGNTRTTVDMSAFADGAYFMNVDGKTVKVVKQ